MFLGWQRLSRDHRRRAAPLPSIPTPIVEDPNEMVPQFFPGCQPRMAAVLAVAVPGSPQPAADELEQHPHGRMAQRRAGSVQLVVDTAARQSSPDAWRASFHSTATLVPPPPHGSTLPRAASCHLQAIHQYHWLPETVVAPPAPATRRPSAIAGLPRAPPMASSHSAMTATRSHSAATIVADDECYEGTTGLSVTRSSSGSSSRTLAGAPGPGHRLLRRIPLIQRSYHLPRRGRELPGLHRNNTTKTVSHNDLSEDAEDTCRLLPSRSTDFTAELTAPDAKSTLFPPMASKALVESVYLDYSDADDIKLAARLLPPTHNSSTQLAYLPPRTGTLAVTNPTIQ
ncbi:hypothetical protein H4R19_005867 [Coemansia spiralis]|nr:hypothetical protein H4R19_005867 [Coemansia spiralis]